MQRFFKKIHRLERMRKSISDRGACVTWVDSVLGGKCGNMASSHSQLKKNTQSVKCQCHCQSPYDVRYQTPDSMITIFIASSLFEVVLRSCCYRNWIIRPDPRSHLLLWKWKYLSKAKEYWSPALDKVRNYLYNYLCS